MPDCPRKFKRFFRYFKTVVATANGDSGFANPVSMIKKSVFRSSCNREHYNAVPFFGTKNADMSAFSIVSSRTFFSMPPA